MAMLVARESKLEVKKDHGAVAQARTLSPDSPSVLELTVHLITRNGHIYMVGALGGGSKAWKNCSGFVCCFSKLQIICENFLCAKAAAMMAIIKLLTAALGHMIQHIWF